MYTDPTHPERPSPFVEEKPSTIFSLMQAEDAQEMSTRGFVSNLGKHRMTKQTISSHLDSKRKLRSR